MEPTSNTKHAPAGATATDATEAPSSLRVAAVQFEPKPSDKEYNIAQIAKWVEKAAQDGVQIVAFPEMCITGYWHVTKKDSEGVRALAEPCLPTPGPSLSAVIDLAKGYNIGVGAGLVEATEDGRLFNTYAVCFPDGKYELHRKIQAFEHKCISSGDKFTVFDTPWGVRMGVLICYDNNIIENCRATALLGAQVVLSPHQTGGTSSRSPHGMKVIPMEKWVNRHADPAAIEAEILGPSGKQWLMRWLPSRAHDNGYFCVFANGVGADDDEVRTGNSMVIDCYGRIIKETWAAADDMVVADCDLTLLDRCTGHRWMRARRPELYGILTQRMGYEMDPRTARFSEAPTNLTAKARVADP